MKKRRYYNSCEFLPLWNFFKITSGEKQNLKYLIVLTDRLKYEEIEVEKSAEVKVFKIWEKIFAEYNALERNFGAKNFISDRSKILYYYSIYLQEQAVFKSLLYRTNVEYIRLLRNRGYIIANTSNEAYWGSLSNGLKQVENHITYIKILKNKISDVKEDSKKEGNPFDATMAWVASNNIEVKEEVTVLRYVKIKEIILQRIKAKQMENSRSRLHG